ncbi:MAG: DUF11 domain-containing protein [Caldilineaceae bacterium]
MINLSQSLARVRPWRTPFFLILIAGMLLLAGHLFFRSTQPVFAQSGVISIPAAQTTPTLDGDCSVGADEYSDAFSATYADAFDSTGTIFLKHDATTLYVCLRGASSFNSTVGPFASVYADTDNGKESLAENDDLGLRVAIQTNALSAVRGAGDGSYTADPAITGWNSKATTGNADQAEWQIPLSLVQAQCGSAFGLAIYHQQIQTVSDAYGWPSNQSFNSPKTWQEVSLAGQLCGPDLAVTKRGVWQQATGQISYTIEVKNNGSAVANDVKLVDVLPAEVHFVSSNPGAPTCTHSGEFTDGTLTCDLGAMNPGASQQVTVLVWPIKVGRLINRVEVTSKETDANPKDNSATAIVSVDAVAIADVSIRKSDSADPVRIGDVFTYTLTVTNNGDDDAQDVKVSDTLPGGVSYLSYSAPSGVTCNESAGVVSCALGTIPVKSTVVIEIQVRATAVGVQTNKASVSQRTPLDPNPANNDATATTTVEGLSGKIAYVFRHDTATAADFKTLLESRGFTVHLIRCPAVPGTDFTQFNGIIIADDTGSLNTWCAAAAGANHIAAAHKPTVGLGEGGYAFFGQLGKPIGWPNGWHGPHDRVKPDNVAASYWHVPTDFGAAPPDPFGLYTTPVNEVGIYLPSASGVLSLGLEPASTDHAPLVAEAEDCNQLWGFSRGPAVMTGNGKDLFVNALVYALGRRCTTPPPIAEECFTLVKSAEPVDGTAVEVGDVITYHLTYTVKDTPACATQRALLEDPIPPDTLYVPGSASDGIAPGGDGVLRWNLGALTPGATGEKKFQVYVTDAQCNNQRRVVNRARLVTTLGVVVSNVVTHPVDCPPVVPAGTQPPWAEDEIQIYPYPMITGQLTEMSVRIRNLTGTPQTVSVSLESSPNNFGIGIPFGPLPTTDANPRMVTLPAFGIVEVKWHWVPTISGHYCVRVKIQGVDDDRVIYTYRNLDVKEDLKAGVEDTLPFAVGNPTAATANVLLVVDNTCPGWQAWVNPDQPDQPLVLADMAPGEVRTATLHVIPPTDRPLGTACHIDVQGWIGSTLIGGIRKLDVPPVHLPPSNPSWLEKEISTDPSPLVVGQSGQICIQLQNPMPFPRVVSVDFAVADFGAGIPFTPVGNLNNITLPANSFNKYCIAWTPTPSNNLHRCIQVILHQDGFADQRSQRNIDLVRRPRLTLNDLLQVQIPFTVGNTALFSRTLEIVPVLVGLPPVIRPHITPDPPPFLEPGAQQEFMLTFEQVGAATATASDATGGNDEDLSGYGDVARVEVGLFLDGEAESGFAVEFDTSSNLYLPLVAK